MIIVNHGMVSHGMVIVGMDVVNHGMVFVERDLLIVNHGMVSGRTLASQRPLLRLMK